MTSPRPRPLHIRLDPLTAPRHTPAMAELCDQLTTTNTLYPGTGLILRYRSNPTQTLHKRSPYVGSPGHSGPLKLLRLFSTKGFKVACSASGFMFYAMRDRLSPHLPAATTKDLMRPTRP